MAVEKSIELGLLFFAVAAVVINIFFGSVIIRVQKREMEIKLAIAMTVVEIFLPIADVITGLSNYFKEPGSSFQPIPCFIKGPFDYVVLPIPIVLGCIISVQRCTRVLNRPVPWILKCLFIAYSVAYVIMAIVAAFLGEFQSSASGHNCSPRLDSLFSHLVLFLLGFNLFLLLIFTLVSYGLIVAYVNSIYSDRKKLMEMRPAYESDFNTIELTGTKPKSWLQRHAFALRTSTTCIFYTVFLAPLSIVIMLGAADHQYDHETTSVVISLLISLISIVNPFLVLFSHSHVYHEFKKLFLAARLISPSSSSTTKC